MTFTIPDVDFADLSTEELKAHELDCAGVENDIRSYAIKVSSEIIRRHQVAFPVTQAVKAPVKLKHYTRDQILRGEDDDFSASMDDFR